MTENICQLYEEEQVGKIRSGRKAIPDNKMPDLGWDATEQLEVQEISQTDTRVSILPKTVKAIIILLMTLLINTMTCIQEISKEIVQAVTSMTRTISRNKFYRKAVHAITDMTRTTLHNSHSQPHRIIHSHKQNKTSKTKTQQ